MVRTLCERRLDGDASCLAVLPQGPGRCLLTVGTYNNVGGVRSGALVFFDILRGSDDFKVRRFPPFSVQPTHGTPNSELAASAARAVPPPAAHGHATHQLHTSPPSGALLFPHRRGL